MFCACGGDTKVLDTHVRGKGRRVWRRRQCKECGIKFSTNEVMAQPKPKKIRTSNVDPDIDAMLRRCYQKKYKKKEAEG